MTSALLSVWSRSRRAAAVGVVLFAIAAGFFVGTTLRQNQILDHGVRVEATVVGRIEARDWGLFDFGRVVVRYPTPDGDLVRQIWLDDEAHAPGGDTWTVIYDAGAPGRVRSVADPNTPNNWGDAFAIIGLLSIVLLVRALVLALRGRAPASLSVRPGETVIPLKGGFGRKELVVDELSVSIHFRPLFGRRLIVTPRGNVTVVRPEVSIADDSGEGWLFTDGFRIATINARQLGSPDLTVLFTERVTLPPLVWMLRLGLGTELDFSGGDAVDGLALRTRNGGATYRTLTEAGIASTDTPVRWLKERRSTTADPALIAAEERNARHAWVFSCLGLFALVAGAITLSLAPEENGTAFVSGLVLAALGLVLPWIRAWSTRLRGKARSASVAGTGNSHHDVHSAD